jgi:hypothetical protein
MVTSHPYTRYLRNSLENLSGQLHKQSEHANALILFESPVRTRLLAVWTLKFDMHVFF